MPQPFENTLNLMEVRGLRKTFTQSRGLLGQRFAIEALRGVSLDIRCGSTLAIVGESGSGKSTLAKCLAGIETPDKGEIWLHGRNLTAIPAKLRLAEFRAVQLVFQDSASSLNPTFTAEEIVTEPFVIERIGSAAERRQRAFALMKQVGLKPEWARRRPLEFSGGQRQRLAIARTLAAQPNLIIFDEALSGLDLLTRAQIVDLLKQIQAQHGLTYVQITHDLDLTRQWSDCIAVMRAGELAGQDRAVDTTREAASAPRLHPQPVPLRAGG